MDAAHPPGALSNPILVGPDGTEHPIPTSGLTIGRLQGNDLVIEDPQVSRRHAEIHYRHGALHLKDLVSFNGTKVNGRLITGEVVLADGDVVQFGETLLTFRNQREQAPVEPRQPITGQPQFAMPRRQPPVEVRPLPPVEPPRPPAEAQVQPPMKLQPWVAPEKSHSPIELPPQIAAEESQPPVEPPQPSPQQPQPAIVVRPPASLGVPPGPKTIAIPIPAGFIGTDQGSVTLTIAVTEQTPGPRGAAAIELKGVLDVKTADLFRYQTQQLLDASVINFTIDCSEVEYFDSSGIGALVALYRAVHGLGGGVCLKQLRPAAKEIIELTRLDRIFVIQ